MKIGIALKELRDEDYMTQWARGYKNIPKGATVKVIKSFNNLYGTYYLVEYNDIRYNVKPSNIEIIEKE